MRMVRVEFCSNDLKGLENLHLKKNNEGWYETIVASSQEAEKIANLVDQNEHLCFFMKHKKGDFRSFMPPYDMDTISVMALG
jgi:hypothetical protein